MVCCATNFTSFASTATMTHLAGFDPPKWLKAGDRVRTEVSGLGHMENEIVAEKKVTGLR